MEIHLEFRGGAERLFDNKVSHSVKLLKGDVSNWDMEKLLDHIRIDLLKERPELFIKGNTVRPGIIVLINDVDWELLGTIKYELNNEDRIVFISTLHGG